MDGLAKNLTLLGLLFLLGLLADGLGRRTALPRVTLLLCLGTALGPWLIDISPEMETVWFPGIADVALVMVGFLLGGQLTLASLRERGKLVVGLSLSVVLSTVVVMSLGLALLGVEIPIALILAGVATATAPAATADVAHELSARGPFTETLLGIVAIDDALGLIAFSLLLAVAGLISGDGAPLELLRMGARDIGGAVLLGLALGIPAAYLTGRILPGEPTLMEALGVVFLCSGIGLWLHVSTLLAGMVLGAVVANLARHHTRPFHEIEHVEWPFMVLFFVFAGASLHVDALLSIGLVGSAYVALRVVGRLIGAWVGGRLTGADPLMRRWMGLALMPQAGVALGMALVVQQRHAEAAALVLPVVIAATVLFELVGPVMTRRALVCVGEVPEKTAEL